jgi:hypothetical protein
MRWRRWMNGTTIGLSISSRYLYCQVKTLVTTST